MKNFIVLVCVVGLSIGLASLSLESNAKSIGSWVGGMIDCPLAGKPCSSDADSTQKERCKISVGASISIDGRPGLGVECSE